MPRRAGRTTTPPIQPPGLRLVYHAFQSADLAMIVFDLDGQVTQANPAAETLVG
jgi:PAS domain-containing protein